MNLLNIFITTTEQKILDFLAKNISKSFFDKEIAERTKISRGATNIALHKLAKTDLIIKEKKGRMNFYRANAGQPIIKSFKILKNVIHIFSLVKELRNSSEKIFLFGSAASGENDFDSDIDLFVLTHNKEEIKKIAQKFKSLPLQLIIKSPKEFFSLEKGDPAFYHELLRGIILWEKS